MKTRKKIAFKIFQWLITAMVALIILIPIYWIFISSIKPNEDLFTIPIEWIPKHFTLKSYKTLIDQVGIIHAKQGIEDAMPSSSTYKRDRESLVK